MQMGLLRMALCLGAALLATPSWALYKVVGPDGRVTYSDIPPPAPAGGPARVEPFKPGHSEAQAANLPFDLRQLSQRFPVVLYTAEDCGPCDAARQLLQQRGVPYRERRLVTEDDGKAYDQLGAGRSLPGLSVGKQQLRGLNTSEWHGYLDAAGYPKTSKLPTGWTAGPATPLTTPAARPATPAPGNAMAAAGAETPVPQRTRRAPPPEPTPAANNPTGIRF